MSDLFEHQPTRIFRPQLPESPEAYNPGGRIAPAVSLPEKPEDFTFRTQGRDWDALTQGWEADLQRRKEFRERLQRGPGSGLSLQDFGLLYDWREKGLVDDDDIYKVIASKNLGEYLGLPPMLVYDCYDELWGEVIEWRQEQHATPQSRAEAVSNSIAMAKNMEPLGRLGMELRALHQQLGNTSGIRMDKVEEFLKMNPASRSEEFHYNRAWENLTPAEQRRVTAMRKAEALWNEIRAIQDTNAKLGRGMPTDPLTFILTSTIQSAPLTGKAVAGGVAGAAVLGVGGAVVGGGLPGFLAGARSGYRLGSFAASSADMIGMMYVDLLAAGVERDNAIALAVVGGSIQGLIESELGTVAGWGKSALKTVAGRALSKEAQKKIAAAASKNFIQKITTSGLAHTIGRNMAVTTVLETGKQALEEGLEEVLQALVDQAMLSLADVMQDAPVERNSWGDEAFWAEMKNSLLGGIAGGIGFGIAGLPLTHAGNVSSLARQTSQLQNLAVTIEDKAKFRELARQVPASKNLSDEQLDQMHASQESGRREYHREEARIAAGVKETGGIGDGYAETKTDPETGESIPQGGVYRTKANRLYTEMDWEKNLFKGGDARIQSRYNLHEHISFHVDGDGKVVIDEYHVRPDLESPELRREFFRDFQERIAERYPGAEIVWNPNSETGVNIRGDLIKNNPRGEKAGLNYYAESDTRDMGGARYRNRVIDNFKKHFPHYGNTVHAVMTDFDELIANIEGRSLEEHINEWYGGLEKRFTRNPNQRIDAAMKEGEKIKGAVSFYGSARDAKAVIYLSKNADLTTYIHETGHIIRRRLSGDMLAQIEKIYGVKNGDWKGKTTNAEGKETIYEELFAEDLERYMRDGYAPSPEVKSLFEKIADFLANIFNHIKEREAVSPEIKEFFDSYFARKQAEKASGDARAAQETSQETQTGNDTAEGTEGSTARYEANKKFNEERDSLDKNNGENDPKLKQTGVATAQELRDKAAKHIDELRDLVHGIAEKYEARVIERPVSEKNLLPIKTTEGIQRKLNDGDNIVEILDVLGMTIVVKDLQTLVKVTEELHSYENVVRIKDRFKFSNEYGYRDILSNIQLLDGMIAEVQINIEQMITAKSDFGGHKYYEIARVLEKEAKSGKLDGEQATNDKEILKKMSKVLFDSAYQAVLAESLFNTSSRGSAMPSLYEELEIVKREGERVLSEFTKNKLKDLGLSANIETVSSPSMRTNSNEGSSNEGTSATGATAETTESSFISLPSTNSIEHKTNSVKENSEKNSEENEKRTAKAEAKWNAAERTVGAEDQITLQTGEEIKGHYELGEAGISTPSVDPSKDFTQSEGFPVNENGTSMNVGRDYTGGFSREAAVRMASEFDQRGMGIIVDTNGVTSSGNNRDISRRIAAKNGTDGKYIRYLQSRPERWGFTQTDVAKYQHPTLYFVVAAPSAYSPLYFDQFNRSGKKSVSPVETAIKMSYLVKDDMVKEFSSVMGNYESITDLYDDTQAATGIFQSLMKRGIVTKNSYPDYVESMTIKGKQVERVTSGGKDFLESVMLGAVLEEDSIRALVMAQDIRKRIVKGLAAMVDNAALGKYGVIPEINQAIGIAVEVQTNKKKYKSIADYANQTELELGQKVSTDIEVELAGRLLEKTEWGFADMMGGLNAVLSEEARGQMDLLGGTSKDDILRRYLGVKANSDEVKAANNKIIESEISRTLEKVQAVMENAGLARGEADGTLFQPAYHGSPYRFDRFDSAHMGRGEGAQAYGWGHYFAGKKEVAEWYRESLSSLSRAEYYVDGIKVNAGNDWVLYSNAVDGRLDDYIQHWEKWLVESKEEGNEAATALAEKNLEQADELVGKKVEQKNGQLYEVDIPGDEEMMDWDKKLSEQPENVKNTIKKLLTWECVSEYDSPVIKVLGRLQSYNDGFGFVNNGPEGRFKTWAEAQKAGIEYVFNHIDGGTFYTILSKHLSKLELAKKGRSENIAFDIYASLALNENGIKGIRYLDGSSRAAGEGSHNYVIFDDGDINITQTFFQLDDQLVEEAAQYESWREFRDSVDPSEASNADNAWYRSLWNDARKIYPSGETLFQDGEAKPTRAQELDNRFYKEADHKYLTETLKAIHRIMQDESPEPDAGADRAEYDRIQRLRGRILSELPRSSSVTGIAAQVNSGRALSSRQYDSLKSYIKKSPREFRSVLADVMGQSEYLEDMADVVDGEPHARLADPRAVRADPTEKLREIADIIRETDPALARDIEDGTASFDDPRVTAFEQGQNAAYEKANTAIEKLELEKESDFARLTNDVKRRMVKLYEEMLAAKERLTGENDKLSRMAAYGRKIAEPYIEQQRLEQASYERAWNAFNDFAKAYGIEADVREALARRDAIAGERARQQKLDMYRRAVKAFREIKQKLIKRTIRKTNNTTVAYEQWSVIQAVQRMAIPLIHEGGNRWIGKGEGRFTRAVWYEWKTDEQFRERLMKEATGYAKKGKALDRGKARAARIAYLLDQEWNSITKTEKEELVKTLPKADFIRDLALKELSRENTESIQLDMEERENANREKYFVVGEELERKITGAIGEELYRRIRNKPFSEWTLTEAAELARAIDTLTVEGRREKRAWDEARRITTQKYRDQVLEAIQKTGIVINPDDSPDEKKRKQAEIDRVLGKYASGGKKNNLFNNFFDANLRRFTTAMDGGSKGIFTSLLYWGAKDATNKRERQIAARRMVIDKVMADNHITLDELCREVAIPGLNALAEGKNLDMFRVSGTNTDIITVDDLLYIRRGYRNEETRKALMFGNLSNATERDFYKQFDGKQLEGSTDELYAFGNVAHGRLMLIMSFANEFFSKAENQKFLQLEEAIGADYDRNGERLNTAIIEMFNRPMWRVADYVPMNRRDQTGGANENRVIEDMLGVTDAGMKWVNKGWSEKRINIPPSRQTPIELGLYKTWAKSVHDTEHFLAYGPLVRELNAVFKGRDSGALKQALRDRWGAAADKRIGDTIAEFARPNPTLQRGALNDFARTLRGKTATAYLAWKLSAVLKQAVTSPWPYLQEIPPPDYLKACLEVAGGKGKINEFIREKSVYMDNRVRDPMLKLVKEQLEQNKHPVTSRIDQFNALGMQGLEQIDWAAVAPGWLAKYRIELVNVAREQETKYQELLQKYHGSEWSDVLASEESKVNRALSEIMTDDQQDYEAVMRADDAVARMQPSGDAIDLAPMFKDRHELMQVVLQFQVALNVIWQNFRYDLPLAVKEKQAGKVVGMITGYAMAGIGLGLLLDDDDEEKKQERNWAAWLLYHSMTQMTDSVPVIGSGVTSLTESLITGKASYQGTSDLWPVPAKIKSAVESASGALREDDPEKKKRKIARAAGNMAEAFFISYGLPSSGLKELGRIAGIGDGDGELEFYPEALLGRRKK